MRRVLDSYREGKTIAIRRERTSPVIAARPRKRLSSHSRRIHSTRLVSLGKIGKTRPCSGPASAGRSTARTGLCGGLNLLLSATASLSHLQGSREIAALQNQPVASQFRNLNREP